MRQKRETKRDCVYVCVRERESKNINEREIDKADL